MNSNELDAVINRLSADSRLRGKLLADPEACAREAGIALSAADCARLRQAAQHIRGAGERHERRFQRGFALILANAGNGADESNDRRWKRGASAPQTQPGWWQRMRQRSWRQWFGKPRQPRADEAS